MQNSFPSTTLLRYLSSASRFTNSTFAFCISCARRSKPSLHCRLHKSARNLQDSAPHSSDPHPTHSTILKPGERKLRTPELKHLRYRDGELVPKPLNRPLGLNYPPQPGQNTGRDLRTWRQKRDDYANYEGYLKRRRQIYVDIFENHYYRDVGNVGKIHKGKSILSPPTPFRSSVALYFPNLEGQTLASAPPWYAALPSIGGTDYRDTTPVLRGRISIVSVVNTKHAGDQATSFTSRENNPALHDYIDAQNQEMLVANETSVGALGAKGAKRTTDNKSSLVPQFAFINVETNPLKAAMIRLSWNQIRQDTPPDQWSTYFLNRRGLTEDLRDALAMWNSKIGYVYLLDPQCRIRWAGNGFARENERESLVNCVRRLVLEAKGVKGVVKGVRREEPDQSGPEERISRGKSQEAQRLSVATETSR